MMPAQLLVQSFVAFAGGLAGGGLLAFTTIVAGDTLLLSTPSAGEGCRVITAEQVGVSASPVPGNQISCVI